MSEECTWHGLPYISVKVNESSVNADTVYMCVHVGEGCTWCAFDRVKGGHGVYVSKGWCACEQRVVCM